MNGSSNLPPADYLERALEAERLAVWVDSRFVEFDARCEELLAGFSRFDLLTNAGTPGIVSDEVAERATLLRAQIHKQWSAVEAAREAIKRPVLAAGRVIDDLAKARGTPLSMARSIIDQRATVYMVAKAEAAKAAADIAEVVGSDADLSRVRSEFGTMGSLKISLDIEVDDVSLVPREWLIEEVDRRRVIAAGVAADRAGKKLPEIAGIRFVRKHGVTMR